MKNTDPKIYFSTHASISIIINKKRYAIYHKIILIAILIAIIKKHISFFYEHLMMIYASVAFTRNSYFYSSFSHTGLYRC